MQRAVTSKPMPAAALAVSVLLVTSGSLRAQTPEQSAERAAQEYAACMISADIECVNRMTDYELFADLSIRDAAWDPASGEQVFEHAQDVLYHPPAMAVDLTQ